MPSGPIDQKFQAMVIECTAEDQKKIRKKLATIMKQIQQIQQLSGRQNVEKANCANKDENKNETEVKNES
uniref:Transcription factor n=1 Tax=Rhabditophanes sp. KR3021 TaxID=114890 RepID=A0AC35U1X3_9BILA